MKYPQIIFSLLFFSFGGSKKKRNFHFFPQLLFLAVLILSRPFITREGIIIMRKYTIKSGYRKERKKSNNLEDNVKYR